MADWSLYILALLMKVMQVEWVHQWIPLGPVGETQQFIGADSLASFTLHGGLQWLTFDFKVTLVCFHKNIVSDGVLKKTVYHYTKMQCHCSTVTTYWHT